MNKKALCIKGFSLEKVDDNGSTIDGEYSIVEDGSVWDIEDDSYRFIGGEIRLVNTDGEWLEISRETLKHYFAVFDLNIGNVQVKKMRFYQFNSVDFGYYALIGAESDIKAMQYYHEEVNEIESFDSFSPEWIHENTVREKFLSYCKTDEERQIASDEFNENIKDNEPYLVLLDRSLL